jgi:hypothetical protein
MRRVTQVCGIASCVSLTVLFGLSPAVGAQSNSVRQGSKAPKWTIEKTVPSTEESTGLDAVSCSSSTDCESFGQMVNSGRYLAPPGGRCGLNRRLRTPQDRPSSEAIDSSGGSKLRHNKLDKKG